MINYKLLDDILRRLETMEAIFYKVENLEGVHHLVVQRVIQAVSITTAISYDKMKSVSRQREVVDARFMCYFLIKLHTKLSLKTIGNIFGSRDHSTVINGLRNHQDMIDCNNKSYITTFKEVCNQYDLLVSQSQIIQEPIINPS